VDLTERVDQFLADRLAAIPVCEAVGFRLPEDGALDPLHHVEIRPHDALVLRSQYRLRDARGGPLEGVDHPVLPEDVVGGFGDLARRRPADHEFPITPGDEQGLVRVALLVVADVVGLDRSEFGFEVAR
jgi:hypothetical protein